MNTTSAPTTSTAITSDAAQAVDTSATTFEQRYDALSRELNAESPEPADAPGEAGNSPAGVPPAASADSAGPAPDAVQRAAERRARLATLQAESRKQVDRKAALAQHDRLEREHAAAVRRAEEAEALAAKRLDVDSLDHAAWLRLAEDKKFDPNTVAQYIRDGIQNPERVAEQAALRAMQAQVDPRLTAAEKRAAAAEERAARVEAEFARRDAMAEEHRATQSFLGMVSKSAERAPLAAKLLAADQEEFMQMASIAAQSVPGMGPQALLDAVEELLDGETRQVAQKFATLYGLISPAAATQPTTRGAAKPTTVSNSFAQERASIVDDEGFSGMSFDERLAKLKSMK